MLASWHYHAQTAWPSKENGFVVGLVVIYLLVLCSSSARIISRLVVHRMALSIGFILPYLVRFILHALPYDFNRILAEFCLLASVRRRSGHF